MFKKAAVLGGLSVSLLSTSAFAGGCVPGPAGPICAPNVVAHPTSAPSIDPMHVYADRPMGHLRSIQYLGTPSVNITRVHGIVGAPALSDAPSGFTGGCTPESTHYCGAHAPSPAPVPVIAPPAPAPVFAAPAPQVTERVVAIGSGYDPSKFIPRTYGSNELTPGIAHIPTSIVDRSHANATAVLNSGRTQPQPIVSGGMVPTPSMVASAPAVVSAGTIAPAPVMSAPAMPGNVIGMVTNTVTMAPDTNVYPGSMMGDGTYYEKVSGPTMLGSTQATQIICKRQAPRMNVQSPVIGVPTPVPTPVCEAVPAAPMMAPAPAPVPMYAPAASGRYGSSVSGSRFGSSGTSRYGH